MTTVVRADVKSGRLIRSIVAEPRAAALPPADLEAMINRIADQQGVETHLVHSVIRAESNYNPNAVSPKGAQGMMQLIPATARRFGVLNTFDAEENVQAGVRYLRFLLDYYNGDYSKTVAAYNAGEGAVDRYHGIPPYAETRNYVSQVARNLAAARRTASLIGNQVAVAPTQPKLADDNETTKPVQTSVGSDGRVYYRTP